MKICFPVPRDNGSTSTIHDHFGSAPYFLIVDTDTGSTTSIDTRDTHHTHGTCTPLKALVGTPIDAVVVSGIGGGALSMLRQAQIRVYRSQAATVGENVELLRCGIFQEIIPQTCGGHAHGHGCGH